MIDGKVIAIAETKLLHPWIISGKGFMSNISLIKIKPIVSNVTIITFLSRAATVFC